MKPDLLPIHLLPPAHDGEIMMALVLFGLIVGVALMFAGSSKR